MVVADNELIDDAYAWISIEIFLEQQWTAGGGEMLPALHHPSCLVRAGRWGWDLYQQNWITPNNWRARACTSSY